MEQKKGKLLRAEKLIVNGEHYKKESEWNGIKTLYYYFTIEFDNGDKGSARSKSEQGSFKIGDEYSYNVNVFNNNGYENKSFLRLKNLSRPFTGGYKRESPEEVKQILNQVALLSANMVMRKVDKEYQEVYKEFRKWLYTQSFDNKEESRTVSGILKIAAGYFQEVDAKDVKLETITKYADSLIKLTKDISWENQSSMSSTQLSAQTSQQSQTTMKIPDIPESATKTSPEPASDLPF